MTKVHLPSKEWDEREKVYDSLNGDLKRYFTQIDSALKRLEYSTSDLEESINNTQNNTQWILDEILEVRMRQAVKEAVKSNYKA